MVVFDVVQTVEPGAGTSEPVGKRIVTHRDDEQEAERLAHIYQACASVSGIHFTVEPRTE